MNTTRQNSLSGRTILITGAGRGLGRFIARACWEAGANLILCARTGSELQATEAGLEKKNPEQRVLALTADVSRIEDVDTMFARAEKEMPPLDGLVNNAGTVGPKGPLQEDDWSEWVHTVNVNLLGAVYACRRAVGGMLSRGAGRIVNISGGGATSPMPNFSAYAASKAALVRFTETLAHEVKDAGIRVNAVAPGALATRMLDEIVDAGPERIGRAYWERASRQRDEGGAPPERAAQLCVFLLSEESRGITGRLISAVWDNWEQLAERSEALASGDVYTLRRIVPGDRGLDWE